ncbi:hypothetical protein [Nocardioides convexus]|uniref:hypothetical protein n=1 Tax=Nocardioides convexus TaxID=2712224 RepID=UPI002418720B|nr:hypothetical protein [Nocardioides convexus]
MTTQTPEQERRTAMEAKLEALHAEQAKAVEAGGKYIARHKERGKAHRPRAHRVCSSTRARRSWRRCRWPGGAATSRSVPAW